MVSWRLVWRRIDEGAPASVRSNPGPGRNRRRAGHRPRPAGHRPTEIRGRRADGDQFDLADRQALRRVAGLSTELEDVTEVEYRQLRLERVVLAGVWTEGTAADAENSLRELDALAETAGSEVLDGRAAAARASRTRRPTSAAARRRSCATSSSATGADTVICDGELAPASGAARGRGQGQGDRPDRADPRHLRPAREEPEGKAQVELAQLEYLLPRLRGWGESMSRQAGGQVGRRCRHRLAWPR